jgi:hypothetical protein
MSKHRCASAGAKWAIFLIVLAGLLFTSTAFAQQGIRHESAFGVRATPIGLNILSDTAYRLELPRGESVLLQGTYLDAGVTTGISPAFVWVGPYVEALPVAVLRLRFSAQYMQYFGNFGYLYVPEGETKDWSLDRLAESADLDLGTASSGMMYEGRITPQIRAGKIVAFVENRLTWMTMDVESDYYEPFFDMLFAPSEFYWVTRPTVGYLLGSNPSHSYLLLALRWERMVATKADVTRDTAGLVYVWKIPTTWMSWGEPTLSGFGGVFLKHPNRGDISPYFGTQFTVRFNPK